MVLGTSVPALAADPAAIPTPTVTATAQDGNDDVDGVLNTAPPASPTESLSNAPTDPALDKEPDIPGGTCQPGQKCPAAGDCDESRWFKPKSLGGKYHWAVGPRNSNYNGTSEKEDMDFTAETSGTVGVSFSGELTTKVSNVLQEVNTKFGVTLSASITAKLGNVVHVKGVPPHKTVYAQYGVWRRKFTGTAYYQHHTCYVTKNPVTGYGPMHVGWYTWDE
ncbi:hypothetical protein [Streptomyces sp. SLBN-31]|uniref:hypothetical protein n=1 Tax=Streptomyces sp. SLBN-31 TaxID=2768444 RepID=UPI0011522A16|nr:hypothetical protein [Streptomyces sp. SLBN-31]